MTHGAGRDAALEEVGRSFKAAMAAVRRLRGRDTHHPGELSYAQYALLFQLDAQGGLSARELADACELSAATVTQMLDSLAEAGLVARVRSVEDKRVVLTSLTPSGSDLISERRARIEPRWKEALSQFTERELLTTARMLDSLRAMFYEFAEAPHPGDAPVTPPQPAPSAPPPQPAPRRAA